MSSFISISIRRFSRQILLAVLFAVLIYLEHWAFYRFNAALMDLVEFKHFVNVGIIYLFFTFIYNRKARLTAYLMIPLFTFLQRLHQVFFGAQIYPIEIWHFFIQFGEVSESFFGNLGIYLLPLVLFIISVGGCLFLHRFDRNIFHIKYMGLFLVLILLIEPYKIFTNTDNFGKQPSVTVIESYNLYGTFSFFLTKLLPQKLMASETAGGQEPPEPIQIEAAVKRNIIFVIGESVRYHHMSLFGYHRKTTPFFDSQVGLSGFIFRKAVSSGVSTDVAIPYLINALTGPDQVQNMVTGAWCLFRMAKVNNMRTYFFSTQTADSMEHIINYLCPDKVDVIKTMDYIENMGELDEADDHSLIKQLDGVDFNASNFIVLHQRGSHSPYKKRFPQHFKKLDETKTNRGDNVDAYDNSLLYGDDFFKSLFSYIEHHTAGSVYLVFTSDHGQALGEQGKNGHGQFLEPVYGVPFVFKAFRGEPEIISIVANLPKVIRHYDISIMIARMLGFEVPESAFINEKYYVGGLDITYENGNWVRIEKGNVIETK
jgi:glucan phosphoethanolaminetransferase (alkaline phosphatase superfamily)